VEIEKYGLSLAWRYMPNDYPLAICGTDHSLFSLWQADRPRDGAPALRKILKPPLRHVKQRNEPAVENDRADCQFQH
jgi:hypothetical protein